MRFTPRSRALLPAMALTIHAGGAVAGNVDAFYLGNGAALQAGAVTADATGGGSIWYNPAGLARVPGLRLDVSASAYALRLGGQPDVSVAGEDSRVQRFTNVDFQIVPSALTLTHKTEDMSLGFGVFVPAQRTSILRTRAVTGGADTDLSIDLLADYYQRVQEYYAGPAWGFSFHPAIDFGLSLLVHYRTELATGAAQVVIADRQGAAGKIVVHETLDWQQIGGQLVFGLQLTPSRRYRLGFTLRTPALRMLNIRQEVSLQAEETPGGRVATAEDATFEEDFGVASSWVAPFRFHAGVSRETGPTRLSLDVNYQTPLYNDDIGIDTSAVVNARLGVRHRLSEALAVGGGIFSDRSPVRRTEEIGDRRVDYYGLTLAADLSSPYVIMSRDGEPLSKPSLLVFGTTVGISYALGLGELLQAKVDTTELLSGVETDLVVHELTVHFGSSLSE